MGLGQRGEKRQSVRWPDQIHLKKGHENWFFSCSMESQSIPTNSDSFPVSLMVTFDRRELVGALNFHRLEPFTPTIFLLLAIVS
jgi:hypothetical protein